MKIPTIKQLMREEAQFVRYEDGKLWYQIAWVDTDLPTHNEHGFITNRFRFFEFPIPVDDSGGGSFGPVEKAITLMRWIRKHLDYLQSAVEDRGQEDGS